MTEWLSDQTAELASVSVVIPTYNRCALLMQTLDACRRHAGSVRLEFVVIDDGSSDETAARLDELSKTMPNLVWRSIENGGPGQARNLGASLANHDVVLFMGDDIQPQDDHFFRIHAELHARHPGLDLAVLGKVVWPSRKGGEVNFVMAHVQGKGGEQFGYSDLYPYSTLDWRFFYTANVSVKRRIVRDWTRDGFSAAFPLAAYEDAEFAYRMMQREPALRILYAPASVGTHHHHFTVNDFINRQMTAGMMARVFVELHPGVHVRSMIGLGGIWNALNQPISADHETSAADYVSVLEGVKSWARLIEDQFQIGSQHWHEDLLKSLFHVCYLQGFVLNWSRPDGNVAAAYRFIVHEFVLHMKHAIHVELAGHALGTSRAVEQVLQIEDVQMGDGIHRSRLRHWARSKPYLREPYRALRDLLARWLT
jgi:glycosyltransferase involved in cell wall biosynthesis